MNFIYLIVILTLDVINCGVQVHRIRRLVGGTDVIEYEFPYQASLKYYGVHICSGTLISNRHVLSAAHCVCGLVDEPSEELSIGTGSIDLKKQEVYVVKNIKCHPGYVFGPDASWTDDLVVVTLSEEIGISPSQLPIALATSDVPVDEHAVISGWGRVHPSSFLSRNLKKLSVPIISNDVCQDYYKHTAILNSQICTFEKKGIGACKGDSGSPLVYNGTLIGVFSWTKPCAIGFPDVSTRISSFTVFIAQAIQDD